MWGARMDPGGAVGPEIVAAVGIGGLLLVTAAASLLLNGPAYHWTAADRAMLQRKGLRRKKALYVGKLAGFDVVVDPRPGAVEFTVSGVDAGLVIEDRSEGPVLVGGVAPTRSRKAMVAALGAAMVGGGLRAEFGQLHLRVPTFVAATGRLEEVVSLLEELLNGFAAPVDWSQVATDPREGLDLRLEGMGYLAAMGGTAAQDVLGDRTNDPESVVRSVAHALRGAFGPLEAHCREEVADVVLPVLCFLPPVQRARVVAARVTTSHERAEPFAVHLLRRIGLGECPPEELRVLASELHDLLSTESPLSFGARRVPTFEGAVAPFAAVLEALARSRAYVDPAWVTLGIELLDEVEETDADRLVEALKQSASIGDVAALRGCETHRARHVIEHLQKQFGGEGGGLALAEAVGGEVAVVGPPAERDDEAG